MEFHQKLASLMSANGYTNYRLARILDVSQSTVANWLSGATVPRRATMRAIANTFHVPLEELFERGASGDSDSFSPDELLMMQKIRALDGHGQKMVW